MSRHEAYCSSGVAVLVECLSLEALVPVGGGGRRLEIAVVTDVLQGRSEGAASDFPPPRLWEQSVWVGRLYAMLLGSGRRSAAFVGALFVLYYLVTNLVASAYGVGLSIEWAQTLVGAGAPRWVLGAAREGVAYAAFEDVVHAGFSICVVFVGGFFASLYLNVAPRALSTLARDSGLRATHDQYCDVVDRIQAQLASPRIFILPLSGAAGAVISFQWLEKLPNLTQWWGHVDYGPAGLLLAINVGVVIGIGILFGEVMSVLMGGFYRLFRAPLDLRPLHPDGCGGFSSLGTVFVIVYCVLACGGLGFTAVYYFGYFGLERTPFFWLCVGVYLAAVFLLVFAPLIWVAARLEAEQKRVLRSLESRFRAMSPLDADPGVAGSGVPSLQDLMVLYDAYRQHPLHPFGGRTFTAIAGTYVAQLAGATWALFAN